MKVGFKVNAALNYPPMAYISNRSSFRIYLGQSTVEETCSLPQMETACYRRLETELHALTS